MKRLIAMILAAIVLVPSCHAAAALLTEGQARGRAIKVLLGDPYGRTPAEVAKNIKDVRFVQDGNTKACGAKKRPAWEFHVVVVTANKDQFDNGIIDGFLALDARNGKVLCANLPMLD